MISVLGQGVAGLCAATALAEAGLPVEVIAPADAPAPVSRLAGGMLAPFCEGESAPPLVVARGQGAVDWWAARVPGVIRRGTLVLAAPRDQRELDRFARLTQGHVPADPGVLEPDLEGRFSRGLFYAAEAHLDPVAALSALRAALIARGTAFHDGPPQGRIVDQPPLALGEDRGVRGVPRHPQACRGAGDSEVVDHDRLQRPPDPAAGDLRPRRRRVRRVLPPGAAAVAAPVAAHPHQQRRRPVTERLVRERTRHGVTRHALGATLPTPRVIVNDAALEYRPVGLDQLADGFEAELIETAERGEVRGRERRVVQVEVFRQMGSVRTSILEDLDVYPRTSRRPSTTPSTAKSRFGRMTRFLLCRAIESTSAVKRGSSALALPATRAQATSASAISSRLEGDFNPAAGLPMRWLSTSHMNPVMLSA